jgi:serine/threonine protein kinase
LTNFNLPFNINAVLKEKNFIISDQCIDLLTKLLVRNPDDRITVKEAIDHPFFTVTNLVDSLNISLDNIAITAANQPETQIEEVSEAEITVEELKQSISDRQQVSIPTIIVLEEDGEFIDISLDKQYDAPFLLKDETLEVEHTVQPSKEVVILVSNEENFEAKTVHVEVEFDGKKENTSISSGGIAQFVFYDVTRETDVNITLSSTLLQRWLYKTVRVHIQIYTHAQ